MPASLLLILIIVALMFSVLSFVAKKLIGFLTGILLLSFVIFGIWWFVKAHQMPLEINKVSRHEIKVVTYPDGSSKQMFFANNFC
jgi:c-di-AMP phosphodiesterase-like protein